MSNVHRWLVRLALVVLATTTTGILTHYALIGERFPARAQTAQSPVSTPTPDAVVLTLQSQVNAQATQIANLEEQVDIQARELRVEVKEKYLPWTVIGGIVGGLGFLGIPVSILVAVRYARNQAKNMIDEAIYKVNPLYTIVHVPQSDFDREKQYLEQLGFRKLRPYQAVDKRLDGCVVVILKDDHDIDEFRRFLREDSPDPKGVAYLLYTKQRVPEDIVDDFPNITFSNTILTLGTNLFTMARGLYTKAEEKE